MTGRTARFILFGMLVAIVLGEVGAQLLEESLPELSEWPTIEVQVKADQLESLDELPDVLVVGSSVTESGIDPARLQDMGAAQSAYNSAFPFYSPAAAEVWLDEFVEPWGEVETLLIGLPAWPPPESPEEDPLTRALQNLAERDGAPHLLDRFALWRLRGVVNDLDEAIDRQRSIARGRWTELGHQTYWQEMSGERFGGHGRYGVPEMAANHQEALADIVIAAQQSGTTPVIIIEPGRFAGQVTDGAIDDYIAWLRSFAAELGVDLWDAYSMDWDPALFADGTHFNYDGTVVYTTYIGEMLAQSDNGT